MPGRIRGLRVLGLGLRAYRCRMDWAQGYELTLEPKCYPQPYSPTQNEAQMSFGQAIIKAYVVLLWWWAVYGWG